MIGKLNRGVSSFQNDCAQAERLWDAAKIVRHTSAEEGAFLTGAVESVWARRVPGCILECGASTGFSTACLSIACHELDYPLVVADSWQGLPDMGPHPEYKPGQFAATFDEWESNVNRFGRPWPITPLKGWFKDTLPTWANLPENRVAMLFMDVDLGSSTREVLQHVLPILSPGGLILTHESEYKYIDDNGQINPATENEVWREIRLAIRGRKYRAYFLWGSLAEVEFI